MNCAGWGLLTHWIDLDTGAKAIKSEIRWLNHSGSMLAAMKDWAVPIECATTAIFVRPVIFGSSHHNLEDSLDYLQNLIHIWH